MPAGGLMPRDRTVYTDEELEVMIKNGEDFCPRRAATYRELLKLRKQQRKAEKSNNNLAN
jgi:hypothetical protein